MHIKQFWITEGFAKKLGIEFIEQNVSLKRVGDIEFNIKYKCDLKIFSCKYLLFDF